MTAQTESAQKGPAPTEAELGGASRPRLRGALIGCGHMGRVHARRLMERDDAELVAILDPIVPAEPHLRALHRGALPAVDFVIIAAPTALHRELAEPLLARGLSVLVEKPLGATREDADALARWPTLSVGHVERFNPAVRALPAGLEPRYIRAERLAPPTGRSPEVDVVADLMVHDLDLAMRLAGGEVVELRAAGVPVLGEGVDIVDLRLETSTGCVVSLVASRVSRRVERRLRVVGDQTYWSLDLVAGTADRVRWGAGELGAEAVAVDKTDAITSLHSAFLAAVRGEGAYPAPGPEGARAVRLAMEVSDLCRQRLERGRPGRS